MMRFFQWISLVVIWTLWTGCATQNRRTESSRPPLVEVNAGVTQYNMVIDFKRNNFSGLLVVKKIDEQHVRIRGISHFGLSMFDFGLEGGQWKVYSLADLLNKKRMIRLLENDFRLLLLPEDKLRIKKDTPDYTSYTAGKGWLKSRIRQYKPNGKGPGETEINHPWLGISMTVKTVDN